MVYQIEIYGLKNFQFYLFGKGNELPAMSVKLELELGDTTKLSGLRGNSLLTDVI